MRKNKRIVVNRHNVQHNSKPENATSLKPELTVQESSKNAYGFEVELIHPETGEVVARFCSSRTKGHTLPCGARIWMETDMDVRFIGQHDEDLGEGLCHTGERREAA